MSEYRADPVTGRWGIVAEGRLARPNEHSASPFPPPTDADCPFCEGHEASTPPEVAAVRPPGSPTDGPGWVVRSIPNRFPTVGEAMFGDTTANWGPFLRRPGSGRHEVIVESPRHAPGLPLLPPDHLRSLFRFFRQRVHFLEGLPSIASVILFENWGPESGGTLWHPHAQIVATAVVPPRLVDEAEELGRRGPNGTGECQLESLAAMEIAAADRIVTDDSVYLTVAPFASAHPYEAWLVPHRHSPTFGDATDEEVDQLAVRLPAILRSLERVWPGASYNWFVHGFRAESHEGADFHWHVEVVPRLLRPDGFELGTGCAVNPVAPEVAATKLRSALMVEASEGARKR